MRGRRFAAIYSLPSCAVRRFCEIVGNDAVATDQHVHVFGKCAQAGAGRVEFACAFDQGTCLVGKCVVPAAMLNVAQEGKRGIEQHNRVARHLARGIHHRFDRTVVVADARFFRAGFDEAADFFLNVFFDALREQFQPA